MDPPLSARLSWLGTIVDQGPPALFATVSGAHLYGFESPDSDFDLRGAFVAPLGQVLGIRSRRETVSILEERDGLELDWVAHDVAKFARLMTRRNGYVLEQLYSPLVVHGGAWLDELRHIGVGCIVRHVYHHYAGFSASQLRLLEGGDSTVKRLLYCYRVLLTGIHVLRSGRVESDVTILASEYDIEGVAELVGRKRSEKEKAALEAGQVEAHRPALDRLRALLDASFEASELPDQVQSFDELDDFVVRARLELGRG